MQAISKFKCPQLVRGFDKICSLLSNAVESGRQMCADLERHDRSINNAHIRRVIYPQLRVDNAL